MASGTARGGEVPWAATTALGAAWWELKQFEARWVIAPLQRAVEFEHAEPLIKLTKVCTRRGAYAAYAAAFLGACPRSRYAELVVAFVVSRRLNEWLKKTVAQPRPYVEFPEDVVFFKKRKTSHSFPSQSVQTLTIAWCAFVDPAPGQQALVLCLCSWYVAALIALVAVVRVYRGLHFPHDVLVSFVVARTLVVAVATLLHSIAGSKQVSALLVGCFAAQELSPDTE